MAQPEVVVLSRRRTSRARVVGLPDISTMSNAASSMSEMSVREKPVSAAMTHPALHIVGNGPGDVPRLNPHEPRVHFNPLGTPSPGAMEIFVSNHRHRGRRDSAGRPFIVESTWLGKAGCRRFEDTLAASATALEAQLGCFPSAGLATVHAAFAMGLRLYVHRMPLKPDLHRLPGMGARQALPCAFHNWLGERRLALGLLRASAATQLCWASLRLPLPVEKPHPDGARPLPELQALLHACGLEAEERLARELTKLAASCLPTWIRSAQPAALRALEPLLFLDRRSRATGNWWLYSNRCAPGLDAVLGRLMLCQQLLDEGSGAPAAS